jgi:hypothetical protein
MARYRLVSHLAPYREPWPEFNSFVLFVAQQIVASSCRSLPLTLWDIAAIELAALDPTRPGWLAAVH